MYGGRKGIARGGEALRQTSLEEAVLKERTARRVRESMEVAGTKEIN